MPNKTYAKEWLTKAWHDLSSARVLYDVKHFTDSIAFDLQQAIEKMLKAILAYENRSIPKTHDLVELSSLLQNTLTFSEHELDMLDQATVYYVKDRYACGDVFLPERSRIGMLLEFSEGLFDRVCRHLQIEENEVKQ